MTVSNQACIFLWSVFGGVIIAFTYDIFRIKRKVLKTVGILVYIEDLAYWILVALVMFSVVYYSNDGELRGYIFLGAVLGVILYILLLSRAIINVAMLVVRVIYKIFKAIWHVLKYPFKLTFFVLKIPGALIGKAITKIFNSIKRTLKGTFILGKRFRNIIKKI